FSLKHIKHVFAPLALCTMRQLEDVADTIPAAIIACTIQVSGRVEYQRTHRVGAKGEKHFLLPASICVGHQLKDHTTAVITAPDRRSIQVSGGGEDQVPLLRIAAVFAALEVMQNAIRPGPI